MKVLSGVLFVGVLAAERCAAATDDGFLGKDDVGADLVKSIQEIAAKYLAELQTQRGTSDSGEIPNFVKELLAPTKEKADARRNMYAALTSYTRALGADSDMFDPMQRLMPIAFDLHDKRAMLYSQMKEMATGLDGSIPREEAAARRRGLRQLLQRLNNLWKEAERRGKAAITDPKDPTFFSEELKEVLVTAFLSLDEAGPFFREFEHLAKEN